MARVTKLGWCCCFRQLDRPACGGLPQSKHCLRKCVLCRSVFLSYGNRCFQATGHDLAAWFNREFQMHGSSNTGTMTISSQVSCTASFPPNLAAASAEAFFGTWLWSMGGTRNGAVPLQSSRTAQLWTQRPILPSCWHPLRWLQSPISLYWCANGR